MNDEVESPLNPGDVPEQFKMRRVQFIKGEHLLAVPFPYEVWRDGIYILDNPLDPDDLVNQEILFPSLADPCPGVLHANRKRIATGAVWISGFGHSIDTGEKLINLNYFDPHGQSHSIWLSREIVADRKFLVPLSANGVPVTANTATALISYLSAFEARNRGIPVRQVGTRVGWHKTDAGEGWLLGDRWIGPGRLEPDPRDQGPFRRAFEWLGRRQAWFDTLKSVDSGGAVARMTVAASFAATLARPLGQRTFFWYLMGTSRFGKSALEKFALSAWGPPEKLKLTFNATQVGLVESLSMITDLPLYVDEKQAAGEKFDFAQFIYSVANQKGRVRSKRAGKLQAMAEWQTIVLTCGEEPIVSETDRGGQRNRVLEIDVSRLPPLPYPARELHDFVDKECHGFAGPEFLERLYPVVNDPTLLGELQERYRAMQKELGEKHPALGEAPANMALVAIARVLLDVWLLGADGPTARERAMADANEILGRFDGALTDPLEERALQALHDHWLSNRMTIVNVHDLSKQAATRGIFGYEIPGEGVFLVASQANFVLTRAGFSPTRVWNAMAEAGWIQMPGVIEKDAEQKYQRTAVRRRFGNSQSRGYLLPQHVWDGQASIERERKQDLEHELQGSLPKDPPLGQAGEYERAAQSVLDALLGPPGKYVPDDDVDPGSME